MVFVEETFSDLWGLKSLVALGSPWQSTEWHSELMRILKVSADVQYKAV